VREKVPSVLAEAWKAASVEARELVLQALFRAAK
jgi:hypothetical protein